MTTLFPHAAYAEDQPSAHSILYLHVARAGAMTGTFISLFTAPVSLLISRYRHHTPFTAATLIPRLLTHSGRGLILGTLFGLGATYGRMMGKTEIEWQDRSWRLQENKEEENTDAVAFGAAAAGAVVSGLAARRGKLMSGVTTGKAVLGGAGLGMSSGMGYMMGTFAMGRESA